MYMIWWATYGNGLENHMRASPMDQKILRGGRFGLPVLELSYRLSVASDDTRYVKFAGFRCAADQVK